jgi:drug/metabolite transporter (DMT)-like permease
MKSQLTGILLGLATAIGCVFYEKIVTSFSYLSMMILYLVFEIPLILIIGYFAFGNDIKNDYQKFISDPKYWYWVAIWAASGVTSICWFYITKKQGVLVGSIFEVKYILILSLIYIFFGENKFTVNTGIGIILAMASIYFISKK